MIGVREIRCLESRPMFERVHTLLRFRTPRLAEAFHVLWRAIHRYSEIDGEQRAAAFAYYSFFALFPLILLLVTIGSSIYSGEASEVQTSVIGFVNQFVPVGSSQQNAVIGTVETVVKTRGGASVIALLGLAWTSLRFFQALVRGVNRAWGTVEYSWWRLPIKNLFMLCVLASALLLGVIMPLGIQAVTSFWDRYNIPLAASVFAQLMDLTRRLVPTVVLFYGFSLFYTLAPRGRKTFRSVWVAALIVTVALQLLKALFVLYARNVANFNAVYGALGSVIALLMWVYLSGSIIIFGACLSAARAGVVALPSSRT